MLRRSTASLAGGIFLLLAMNALGAFVQGFFMNKGMNKMPQKESISHPDSEYYECLYDPDAAPVERPDIPDAWTMDFGTWTALNDFNYRTIFSEGPLATVLGWPSKGGVYVLEADLVDLDFMRLDRFSPTPKSEDQQEEDEHCARMRQLGAVWWPDASEYTWYWTLDGRKAPHRAKFMVVGWPESGGVWVLEETMMEAKRKGSGRIHGARSMEERCREMEKLGAQFWLDPKECPKLKWK